MEPRPLLRPFRAHHRLGWATVGTLAAVEGAKDPVISEIATGRNDLRSEDVIFLALYPAKIRRLPVSNERLEKRLPRGAANLRLQVAAAGGAPLMVRGLALCGGARVGDGRKWQAAAYRFGMGQPPRHQAFMVRDDKSVAAKTARGGAMLWRGDLAAKAMGRATYGVAAASGLEVATGDMDRRLAPELVVLLERCSESDPLRVTKEPGGVVIGIGIERGNAHCYVERTALTTETPTSGRSHGSPK